MRNRYRIILFIFALTMIFSLLSGYHAQGKLDGLDSESTPEFKSDEIQLTPEPVPLSEYLLASTFLSSSNNEMDVVSNDKALINLSNASNGYVMIKHVQETSKELRAKIISPTGLIFVYALRSDAEYEVFPFSDGDGEYQIFVFEQIEGTRYALVLSTTRTVNLINEFAPFLQPNQYVNYEAESRAVKKAEELTKNAKTVAETISAIYTYIINNIKYDEELAKVVKTGYTSDVDAVLESGKGICLDYAVLMTVMLRSQGIPTRLVVGYTGGVYHAWMDVYSDEDGWISGVIKLKGNSWNRMDPTFAATSNQSSVVLKYIGDGTNYAPKFFY